MTTNATVSPPSLTTARRFSEQIHALVDRQTRELVLGLAVLDAKAGGYSRPREGEQVRNLLDDAIGRLFKRDPALYGEAVRAGRAELARRESPSTVTSA
jgi:hypothetical protein